MTKRDGSHLVTVQRTMAKGVTKIVNRRSFVGLPDHFEQSSAASDLSHSPYGALQKIMLAESTLMTEPGLLKKRYITLRLDQDQFTIVAPKQTHHIRYGDVTVFAFQSIAQYINGIAQGTTHVLELAAGAEQFRFVFIEDTKRVKSNRVFGVPLPFDIPGNSIRVNVETDPVLATLRDTLQQYVAKTMMDDFNLGNQIQWVPEVTIADQGFRFRDAFANFDQITAYRINNGELEIDTNSDELTSLKIPFGAPNFLPGFVLFEEILYSRGMIEQKLS